MQNNVRVIEAMPEQTSIEVLRGNCPECGQQQNIFGGWPNGYLINHTCEKCKQEMIFKVNRQEKLI